MKRSLLLGMLALLPLHHGTAADGDTRVEAAMVLQAESRDPILIANLLEQQLIPVAPETVKGILVMDLAGDGFGEGDLLKLLPAGDSHLLRPLSEELRSTLGAWAFASHHEITASAGLRPEGLRGLDLPAAGLLADVMSAARRHLGLAEFELAVDRRGESLQLRIWDYPGDSLYHRPGMGADGGRVVDVVQILRADTTYVVDKVLHDLLILESQVVDTVYLPASKP